jgi:hypothetical protein
MRIFTCGNCNQLVYFENSLCTRCRYALGFDAGALTLLTLHDAADGSFVSEDGSAWRACANSGQGGCNWLVPAAAPEAHCRACVLNRTIPDLTLAQNLTRWQAIEFSKRRLIYALLRFGLPLASRREDQDRGLAFDFLSQEGSDAPVMTGHDDGLITINIAEADPAERERLRTDLGENYRTLLGHFRHEVGHYYWDLLVRDDGDGDGGGEGTRLDEARALFGDEREDYAAALQRHYDEGPPPDWQERFVSSYATMHPWEDFAETWTHYLHIVDTLDTAASFGLGVDPTVTNDPALKAEVAFDPYAEAGLDRLIAAWLPLTYAVNSLNRSMGQPDLYPFVLSEPAIDKLRFIHDLVRGARG